MNNGGDVLARGGKSAQFGGTSVISDFENDFIYKTMDEVCQKYGLSQAEYDQYNAERMEGIRLPDLKSTESREEVGVGFSVVDNRKSYMDLNKVEVVSEPTQGFPEGEYGSFRPILDRILVMRVADDKNMEMLSDGSMRNKTTGFIIPAKYRQHSNVGVVLSIGHYAIMGGVKVPLTDIVKVGDKVTYGDYNSEILQMDEKKAEGLCNSVGINYTHDEQGLRIVRIQDVRGIEPVKVPQELVTGGAPCQES